MTIRGVMGGAFGRDFVVGAEVGAGGAAPPATPWYLEGGVSAANCIAAYQPKGAADIAASYVNLASPGTNDAAPGSAPTFDTATGWYFATNKYLVVGSGALLTAVPMSMICRFQAPNVTTNYALMSTHRKTVQLNSFALYASGGNTGDPVEAYTTSNITYPYAKSSAGYTANVWYVATGVWAAANSRAAYLDGANKGTNTTSVTPSGIDETTIGVTHNSSEYGNYLAGYVAACAFYNVALSDAQVLAISTAMAAL